MKKALFATTILAVWATPASAQGLKSGIGADTPQKAATEVSANGSSDMQTPASSAVSADAGQSQPDANIPDIIVTAQQRSENLQKAAISVTALNADSLVRGNVTDVTRLTNLVPALRANPASGPYGNFAIRGISNFITNSQQDNGIVVNVGGVPLARPTGPNGFFFDLERVEVLKGPQGILYGRNATGGVINVIPKGPGDSLRSSVSVNTGTFDLLQVNAAIDVPLADGFTSRVAVQSVRHDGYYGDGSSDEDMQSARMTLRYAAIPNLTMTLVADYARQRGVGPGASLIYSETATSNVTGARGFIVGPWTGQLDPSARIQNLFTAAGVSARRRDSVFQDNIYWGVTGTANVTTAIGTFTGIAAHRVTDINFESLVSTFYQGEDGPQYQNSLELRLASDDRRPIRYLAGAFLLDEHVHVQQLNEQNLALSNSDLNLHNRTLAGFGQLTWAVDDHIRLTGGLRYNSDDKNSDSPRYTIANYPFATTSLRDRPPPYSGTYVGTVQQARTFNSLTWKAGFEVDAARDSLVYGNVATGFKAGGFSYGPPGGVAFDPEHVTSYVLGTKNRFFGRKLQFNVEAFYLRYRDQQVQFLATLPGIGNFALTRNVAASTIKGVEWDVLYLVGQNTRLGIGGVYQKATYDDFKYITPTNPFNTQTCPVTVVTGGFQVDCSGRQLINAPEWVLQGSIDQTLPLGNGGTIVASLQERFESSRETYLSYLKESRAVPYNRTDVSITYNAPSRKWSLSAYVQNVEDRAVYAIVNPGRSYTITGGGLLNASLQPPRTAGVRGTVNF